MIKVVATTEYDHDYDTTIDVVVVTVNGLSFVHHVYDMRGNGRAIAMKLAQDTAMALGVQMESHPSDPEPHPRFRP